jgi:N-acetyl-beta-hexosaminidase
VALLPVLPTPVASQQEGLLASFPELYKAAQKAADARHTLLIDTREYWQAYNKRLEEVFGLFSDSPYLHIGETAEKGGYAQPEKNQPRVDTYLKEHNLRGRNDYYTYYMTQVSKAILAQGRSPIIWGGYDTCPDPSAPVNLPVEVIIEYYDLSYSPPEPFVKGGYRIINASRRPYYIVGIRRCTPREIYEWDIRRMGDHQRSHVYTAPPEAKVLGVSMCGWEGTPGQVAFDAFRPRIPAMAEPNWNAAAGRTFEDYQKRFTAPDALLERLLYGMRVQVKGLTPVTTLYDINQPYWFSDKAQVAFATVIPGSQIRYTLDDKEVTPESALYAGPIMLDRTTTVRARLFTAGGNPLGLEFSATFELHPLSGRATSLLDNPHYTDRTGRPDTFRNAMTLTLRSARKGGTIRYTLDGKRAMTLTLRSARKGGTIRYTLDGKRVDGKSPVYTNAITITTPVRVQAQYFDEKNQPAGALWHMKYTNRGYQKSLATGANATGSGREGVSTAHLAVDGMVDKDQHWSATPCPTWLQVELKKPAKIGCVEIVFYWDKHRYYQYTVDASMDGKTWTTVVNASKNTEISTEKGYRHELDCIEARFLRVTVLKNSANPAAHIVELRAYE